MPNVELKNYKTGAEAKEAILKNFPSNNMYQRLKKSLEILSYNAVTRSKARGKVHDIVNACLDRMAPYYEGNDKENVVHMDLDQFSKAAGDLGDVARYLMQELPKAIKGYDDYLLKKDDIYKENNGEYLNTKINETYIYRHVALDELKEVYEMAKNLEQNISFTFNQLALGQVKTATIQDVIVGRSESIKALGGQAGRIDRTRIDTWLTNTIEVLGKFAATGNAAAAEAYEKIKNLDLSAYYKLANGNYPTLTSDAVNGLLVVSDRIKQISNDFLSKITTEDRELLNQMLVPETVGVDGKYPEAAASYRNKLVDAFKNLGYISDVMTSQLEKAVRHPEIYTLPAVLKQTDSDQFMGENSLENNVQSLLAAANTIHGKADNGKERVNATVAANQIRARVEEVSKELAKLYEIGPDGYYVSVPVQQLSIIRDKIAELEKSVEDNRQSIMDNTAASSLKDAEKYINNITKIAKMHKDAIDKAEKDCQKSAEGSFERANVILAGYIDPNPQVRKIMQDVRQQRIDASYEAQENEINAKFDGNNLNACETLATRLTMFEQNKYFQNNVDNRKAVEDLDIKFNSMITKLATFYNRDEHGGYTRFGNEAGKTEILKSMAETQEAIKAALKKKLPQSVTDNLKEVDNLITKHREVLGKASIAGNFPIPELLDAGRFGYPSLDEALQNCQGYDRYDWLETGQKNDQEWVMYDYYKNPTQKILQDAEKFRVTSENPKYKYSDNEKDWLKQVTDYMKANFGKEFLDKYYKKVPKFDEQFNIDTSHYPLMTKEDQEALREKFHGLKDILDNIGGTDAYKNSKNAPLKAFLNGVATYANETSHRLDEFHSELDLPLYTIQEATSGRADTSEYNFRNEIERFARFHKDETLAKKLTDAKILLSDEEKWENPEKTVRKKEFEQLGFLSKVFTYFNKDYSPSYEFVKDYNDLLSYLTLIREFENDYFRCNEDGEYRTLPRTGESVSEAGFDGKINTYEKLKHVYTQIQYLSMILADKADKFNKGKKPEQQIPDEYVKSLRALHDKGLICQTLLAMNDGKRSNPNQIDIMELIHSDPVKRKNMWITRQNKLFYKSLQEEGQLGTYRKLEHFQYEYDSDMTYNGRFYENPKVPEKGEELNAHLDGLVGKYGAGASDEGKTFAQKLIDAAKNDPDAVSEFIPTVGDIKKNENALRDGSILKDATDKLSLGTYKWWENEKDRQMIRDIVGSMSAIGISKADHEARKVRGAKYGEDLSKHYLFLSNMADKLGVTKPNDMAYERIIPKVDMRNLNVPGETGKPHRGMMVEAIPEKLDHIRVQDPETKEFKEVSAKVITGKQLVLEDNGLGVSIQPFNDPKFIRDIANLQALCFLCNAPLPKLEDLKFALVPDHKGNVSSVRLMGYMPDPAFLEGDKFEGKINLEDLGVIPDSLGNKIKNLLGGDISKEEKQENLRKFAEEIMGKNTGLSEDAKKRIEGVIMKRTEEMSKFLNNKEKTKEGDLIGKKKDQHLNGIRDKKILITKDFKNLTIDKLSLKKNIFATKPDGRNNLFTQISDIPERKYHLTRKNGDNKEIFGERFRDGVKRELNRLNLETTLADLENMEDEYLFHKDSKYYKNMRNALKVLDKLEKTGVIEYKNDLGETKQININNITPNANGRIDDDVVKVINDAYTDAQKQVQKYIKERKGTIFNPLHKFGRIRLSAARTINDKLNESLSTLTDLCTYESTINEDDLENEAVNQDAPVVNEAPKENAPKERISVNDLKEEEPKIENKDKDNKKKAPQKKEGEKEEDKKDNKEKGKGGKNK